MRINKRFIVTNVSIITKKILHNQKVDNWLKKTIGKHLKLNIIWKAIRQYWSQFHTFIFFFFLFRATPTIYGSSQVRVKSELQLLAYTTATATQDLSCVCDLHHSSWHWRMVNPLSEARDWTWILMDASWVHNPLSHNRNSHTFFPLTQEFQFKNKC